MRKVVIANVDRHGKEQTVVFANIPSTYEGLRVEDRRPSDSALDKFLYWRNKDRPPGVRKWEISSKRVALIKTSLNGRGYGSDCWYIVGFLVGFRDGGSLLLVANQNGNAVIKDKGFNPYVVVKKR